MSEENNNPPVIEENKIQAGAEGSGLTMSNAETEIQQLKILAKSDPAFANSDEYKNIMSEYEKSKQGGKQKPTPQASSEKKVETSAVAQEDETSQEDEVDEDDLFGLTKPKKQPKPIELNFEPPQEMLGFIKERYGIEDATKFFESTEKWRTQAQEGAQIRKNYDAILEDLSVMPPDLRTAIEAWSNGDDYTDVFLNNSRLDFTQPYDKQDKESLVQHYLSEEYTELMEDLESEKITEEEFKKQVATLAKATNKLFTRDKQALEEDKANYRSRQAEQAKRYKESALSSVDALSKAYPNFDKRIINDVRATLVEGKVDDLFLDEKGYYKQEAAEVIAFAKFGKQMLEVIRKQGERAGESKVNRKVVDSSPSSMRGQKDSQLHQQSQQEQAAIAHLTGGRKTIFD